MENGKLCRTRCLLDSRNLVAAFNLLLEELDKDFFRGRLEPCSVCRTAGTPGDAGDFHGRLREVFDTLLRARDLILEMRGQANLQRN